MATLGRFLMADRIVLALIPVVLAVACSSPDEPTALPSSGGAGGAPVSTGGQPPTATGGGPTSGGAPGTGGTESVGEATEVRQEGDRVRISVGDLEMVVAADNGARIIEFSREGQNILLPSSVHWENFGSTFWTSPQEDWEWPPPHDIDRASYEIVLEEDSVLLRGPQAESLGVRAEKRFEPLENDRAIRVTYGLVNVSGEAVTYAPWEVTRVRAGGLTFFRPGTLVLNTSDLAVTSLAGHTWYSSSGSSEFDGKYHADGQGGWIAHADAGLLLVKSFSDLPTSAFAPDHAEIEIFANADGTYVEIEQQGAYQALQPGSRLDWAVEWRLEELPNGTPLVAGSTELIQAAADAQR